MRLSCGRINTTFEYNSPTDFLQSQWQTREKSFVYLIYRWIIACFFIISVMTSIATATFYVQLQFYLLYLTHWNLIFTMITMVWSAYLVTLHYFDRLEVKEKMTRDLKIFWFLSTSSNMYAYLVTMIYWLVLFKTDVNKIDMNNIFIHATNSLVPFIDLAMVKHPERFGLFIYPLFCGCIYLFFTWLYPWLGGQNRRGQDFIYPILNWKQKPGVALISGIGITVSGALVHFFLVGLQRMRSKIHEKYFARKEKTDILLLTC